MNTLTERELEYCRRVTELIQSALKLTGGDEKSAAALLFTVGVRMCADQGRDELHLSDMMFSLMRDHENDQGLA
jgi:hypothetical protein